MSRDQLQDLQAKLYATNPKNREAFAEALRASMDALGLDDYDVSEEFDASWPSVNRWRNGNSAPSPCRPIAC